MTLLTNAVVITGSSTVDARSTWIRIEDGLVTGAGTGTPHPHPGEDTLDLRGATVVPGFVDIHTHGGAGHTYATTDVDAAAAARAFHLRAGTTTTLASLVTEDLDMLELQLRELSPLIDDGTFAGFHLEGPWISRECKGAHNEALLRDPDPAEINRFLEAGDGRISMLTIAPELPGGLESVRLVADAGAIAAVGHTAASYERTLEAVEAGATVATHLFNGMKPIHHRTPGAVTALLSSPGVTIELIADGHHLHPGTIEFAVDHVGTRRSVLITDAMAAAGMGDGDYGLGRMTVEVRGGVARLAGNGSIAGSTLTMAAAVKFVVDQVGLSLDDAVQMASVTPASVLGHYDIGVIEPGRHADLTVLDADLLVIGVMRHGSWIVTP